MTKINITIPEILRLAENSFKEIKDDKKKIENIKNKKLTKWILGRETLYKPKIK